MPDSRRGAKQSAQLYWTANLARNFEGRGGRMQQQALNSVVIFRDCSGRCSSRADAVRFDSPQPSAAFNLGCGWEPSMRSLINTPIVVAGVDLRGDGWRAGRTASSHESASRLRPNGNRASRFPILEPESRLEGLLAFRPTKEAPTVRESHRLRRPKRRIVWEGRVSSGRSLPCPRARPLGLAGLAQLAAPDSAVAAALCCEAAIPAATYGWDEYSSS
jgi:hypothetical protein